MNFTSQSGNLQIDYASEYIYADKLTTNTLRSLFLPLSHTPMMHNAGNLMLGSSLLAAAIPLGALVLPLGDSRKRRVGLLTDEQSGGVGVSRFSLQSRVDSMMSWIERSVEHLPNIPRLHPQECVKRSICEAHNDPNKYGAIGFILRLLFP